MKRIILLLIFVIILFLDLHVAGVVYGEGEYKQEVRLGRIQDMIVFKNELYLLRTYLFTSTSGAAIYKYVDEKIPPILQLAPDYGGQWKSEDAKSFYDRSDPRFKDNPTQLISFEIYNGELYAGGPLGIFKLNEATGGWDYVEFGYGFSYVPEKGVHIGRIKAIGGALYGVAHYRGRFKEPGSESGQETETNVAAFVKLNGGTWQLAAKPYSGYTSDRNLLFATDFEFMDSRFFAAELSVKVLGEGQGAEDSEKHWEMISPSAELKDLGERIELVVFNNKLYILGLLRGSKVYVLDKLSKNEERGFSGEWQEVLDVERYCEFIDTVRGELLVGTSLNYGEDGRGVKVLHRFDGTNWGGIDFTNAPGLSEGQFVTSVTAAELFNGDIFLAVETSAGKYDTHPSLYIIEDNKLRPVTWFK